MFHLCHPASQHSELVQDYHLQYRVILSFFCWVTVFLLFFLGLDNIHISVLQRNHQTIQSCPAPRRLRINGLISRSEWPESMDQILQNTLHRQTSLLLSIHRANIYRSLTPIILTDTKKETQTQLCPLKSPGNRVSRKTLNMF